MGASQSSVEIIDAIATWSRSCRRRDKKKSDEDPSKSPSCACDISELLPRGWRFPPRRHPRGELPSSVEAIDSIVKVRDVSLYARARLSTFFALSLSLSLWFFSFFFFPFSWQRTWMCASCSERVTVERTLHGNTRKAKTPRTSAVRACTRDVHNHGCIVAILEIAVCFPPEGIEPATLEVTHRQCPVIFLAAALKNARRVPLLPFPLSLSLSHSFVL